MTRTGLAAFAGFWGQVVGKAWMTLAAVLLLAAARALLARNAQTELA